MLLDLSLIHNWRFFFPDHGAGQLQGDLGGRDFALLPGDALLLQQLLLHLLLDCYKLLLLQLDPLQTLQNYPWTLRGLC